MRGSACWRDPNLEDALLPRRPFQLNGQEAIVQLGLPDFHSLGQGEGSFEPARCDAVVKIVLWTFLAPRAANCKLSIFDAYLQFVAPEAGDRQRDAQNLSFTLVRVHKFDVVGRITIVRPLRLRAQTGKA